MLLALPMGILIGLSLGALGGGGSILTVPALVYLLGVNPHSATTASLIIVGFTSLVGVAAHLRTGRVRVRPGIIFGVLGAGGAYAGSLVSSSIDPKPAVLDYGQEQAQPPDVECRRPVPTSGRHVNAPPTCRSYFFLVVRAIAPTAGARVSHNPMVTTIDVR